MVRTNASAARILGSTVAITLTAVKQFDRATLHTAGIFRHYRTVRAVHAARVHGPFSVHTREGLMPCADGYLVVDDQGDPYPITRDVFEARYEVSE